MGVVYRARQLRLNREVALKMILAGDHASGDTLARFTAEAETIAKLRHPNIVQIYAISDWEGRPFVRARICRGRKLGVQARRHSVAASSCRKASRKTRASRRRGPPTWHRSPRLETRQYSDDSQRRAKDFRLWPGQDTRRGFGPDPDRIDPRLTELHGTGTGGWTRQRCRTIGGSLRVGCESLRATDGSAAIRGSGRSWRHSTWSRMPIRSRLEGSSPCSTAISRRSA